MRGLLLSTLTAVYLFGAAEQSGNILGEVAKLRQKYEECRAGQSAVLGIDPKLYGQCEKERNESNGKLKGYTSRIANLEGQIQQNTKELSQLKKRNTEIERELIQKKGIIQSLEKTVNSRDKKYREEAARNEILSTQTNTAKVSRIERQSLTNALTKAKFEVERLEQVVSKTTKERMKLEKELTDARAQADKYRNVRPLSASKIQEMKTVVIPSDQNGKIKVLQDELSKANAVIVQLRNNATTALPKEKIVEKVVYKNRTVEKIVEKVVYKDRPVVQEKIVEKVVYKDRPIPPVKVALKSANATERLNKALQQKLTPPKTTKAIVSKELKAPVAVASAPVKQGKSSAYRMASNAPIYNVPGGHQVDTWEERRSFTAGNPSNGWVHITGYFVNRVWQRTAEGENLWVKESDVIRR